MYLLIECLNQIHYFATPENNKQNIIKATHFRHQNLGYKTILPVPESQQTSSCCFNLTLYEDHKSISKNN